MMRKKKNWFLSVFIGTKALHNQKNLVRHNYFLFSFCFIIVVFFITSADLVVGY